MPILIPPGLPMYFTDAQSPYYAMVDEIWNGRTGTPYEMGGKRNYQRKFLVVSKIKEMSPWGACAAPGIPLPGTPYFTPGGQEFDLLAISIRYQAKLRSDDDWQNWEVTVDYSTELPPGGKPELPNDAKNHPELEPADLKWGFEVQQVALQCDLDGKPFLNSAYMPLTPAPTFDVACPVLSITRNEMSFSAAKANAYSFAVNNDQFLGAVPGRAQCMPPDAEMKFRGLYTYWRVGYKIRFAPYLPDPSDETGLALKTWQPQFVDQGMMEWDDDKQINKTIFTDARNKVTSPVLLNGLGKRQRDIGENGAPIAKWLNFRVYRELSFSALLVQGLS